MSLPEHNGYVGHMVGKYRIVERIGKGGMAVVYKAYQENLDRFVAVKLMHSFLAEDGEFLERFKREARAMGALKHPQIAAVYDFDVIDDTYYIVMEYIDGGSLKEELVTLSRSGQRMALGRALRLAIEIADALTYAHQRGMVHRDIKPGNILLRPDGGTVLTDFGIAKMLGGATNTVTGAMVGTPAYMAPEQGLGQLGDARADVYALGILLFQLTTGHLPFNSPTPVAVVMMHVSEPLPLPRSFNTELPLVIQEVIQRAAAKEPVDRFQTAADLATALRQAAQALKLSSADGLPASLLQGGPTVAPQDTVVAQATVATGDDVPGLEAVSAEETILHMPADASTAPARPPLPPLPELGRPVTSTPMASKPATGPANASPSRRRWGIWLAAVALLLIVVGGGLALTLRERDPIAEPAVAAAPVVAPATATATAAASPTWTLPATFSGATGTEAASGEVATLGPPPATATATRTATATATTTPGPTPDATAVYLAECVFSLSLADLSVTSVTASASYTQTLIVTNDGTCSWAADWQLADPQEVWPAQPLAAAVAPSEPVTLTLPLTAPDADGTQMVNVVLADAEGNVVAGMLTARVAVLEPATPTPRPTALPMPTSTPAPTVTPAEVAALDFNISFNWCEYAGDDWRCEMVITPYGGIGAPYTVWVFDSEPPARYFGEGSLFHIVRGRRCFPWVNEIKAQDDSGNSLSRNYFFDPATDPFITPLFPGGGCVIP